MTSSCCGRAQARVSIAKVDFEEYARHLARMKTDPNKKQLEILATRKKSYEDAKELLVDHEATCTRLLPAEE